MRYGDHNFRNRQLYEECHENPYYQKKLELMEKKQTDEEIVDEYSKNVGRKAHVERVAWLRTTLSQVRKEERARIIEEVEKYFKGLVLILNPKATKENIINIIKK